MNAARLTALKALQQRVREANGPSHELDIALTQFFYPEMGVDVLSAHGARLDRSLDACLSLMREVLPGWTWKVGTCCVSDDAWVAPDLNCPVHGERLRAEFGDIEFGSIWDTGVDIDRRPPGNVPLALIEAIIAAKITKEEAREVVA